MKPEREVFMKTITIRGIDQTLDGMIKKNATENNMSINQWILSSLKKISGLEKEPVFKKHHDLDALAGGWSRKEASEFRKNTGIFEKIDEDIWK
jgi:hypothetical protein